MVIICRVGEFLKTSVPLSLVHTSSADTALAADVRSQWITEDLAGSACESVMQGPLGLRGSISHIREYYVNTARRGF
jgi:hypothetical protein